MNYEKAYTDLIQNRLKRVLPTGTYGEKHHIVPRSLGGNDDKSNIVKLTPKEHFVAHRLLAKIHGGKMWAALAYMSRGATNSARGVRVSSRLYDTIKRNDAKWRSVAYAGENAYWYNKKIPDHIIEKFKGPRPAIAGKNNPNYGVVDKDKNLLISFVKNYRKDNLKINYEIINRINKATGVREQFEANGNKIKIINIETNKIKKRLVFISNNERDRRGKNNPNFGNGDKIRGENNPMFGRTHTSDTLLKISNKAKQRQVVSCPKCNKQGSVQNMTRWHFDNCRAA